MSLQSTVAGIDVGGDRKGCHLVILHGSRIVVNLNSTSPAVMLEACLDHDVIAVGIDAPCRWRTGESGRQAERQLAQQRIASFATPTRQQAESNTSGFYAWMFNGERMYQTFSAHYPLFDGCLNARARFCFETFPHAITCAKLGREVASAKLKRTQRQAVLELTGIDTTTLKSIDDIDAALCAQMANWLLAGQAHAYGDALDGYIVVPHSKTGEATAGSVPLFDSQQL
ncbi:DUF429 domain-containing protein [Paraburkholderia sp. PREW-6R]|uniref:DUF429 domain-containing protein n=1 Tax=Paraburkholderia sp. PREW-6R TaxID=3141544 RepID=UPI0031F55B00